LAVRWAIKVIVSAHKDCFNKGSNYKQRGTTQFLRPYSETRDAVVVVYKPMYV